tara:strand:- start:47128 stop:47466 length:339 start_codon:yes stop_codon:yes gene_type:complete
MSTSTLGFTAINFISCSSDYESRFEELFTSRVGEIDRHPGFRNMNVLKPQTQGDDYLIISNWDSEQKFKEWTQSEAFIKGHKRGFEDIRTAREEGKEPPMTSSFKTYTILTK